MDSSDEQQLRGLIRDYARPLGWFIAQRELDSMVGEELLADVFELAYQHLAELATLNASQVRSWLTRTASNLVANETRRGATRRRLLDRLGAHPDVVSESPEDGHIAAFDRHERGASVRQALDKLAPEYRTVLSYAATGDNGPAIAARLGVSHQAARTRLMRARAAFVQNLDDPTFRRPPT